MSNAVIRNMDYSIFNPEGSELRNVQLQMLEIVKFIDNICHEHGIHYILDGGSCLGAIRHKGFIPWDDDIDIALLEPDYKKLISILRQIKSEKYVLHCQQTDFNYVNIFPKYRMREGNFMGSFPNRGRLYKWRGPGVDIFCFQKNSYIAAKVSAAVKSRLLSWTWRVRPSLCRYVTTKVMYGVWLCGMPLYKLLNLTRKPHEMHNALGMSWAHLFIDERHLSPIIRVPFEDAMLPVPAHYDEFLTSLFGNWRTPPSLEEIIKHGVHSKELFTHSSI